MENVLDRNEVPVNIVSYRRSLLPWWVKLFCWLFMIFGAMVIPIAILGLFDFHVNIAFYGIESSTVFNLQWAIVSTLFVLSGIVGYGLFYGKDWAIWAGLLLCAMHVVLVASLIAFPLSNANSKIRLEFVLVIIFFIKLLKLKPIWYLPKNTNP